MTGANLNDRYEGLRRRATEGGPAQRDGLAMLRQQGLHAWIARVATSPATPPRAQAVAPSGLDPPVTAVARSPLVSLCTDMLLATLTHEEAR